MTDGVKKAVEQFGMPVREAPICPICGSECDTIYKDARDGIVVGCEVCVKAYDAWDVEC